MLRSCVYCSRIHDSKMDCGKKPCKEKYKGDIYRFRNSRPWQKKREQIKSRDNYLCQICVRKLYNTTTVYNAAGLSVHHVEPMSECWDKRLEDDNLVTICEYHHEMAESGEIPRAELKRIVEEQEAK